MLLASLRSQQPFPCNGHSGGGGGGGAGTDTGTSGTGSGGTGTGTGSDGDGDGDGDGGVGTGNVGGGSVGCEGDHESVHGSQPPSPWDVVSCIEVIEHLPSENDAAFGTPLLPPSYRATHTRTIDILVILTYSCN